MIWVLLDYRKNKYVFFVKYVRKFGRNTYLFFRKSNEAKSVTGKYTISSVVRLRLIK